MAASGAIPAPARVILETTGLADPGPVLKILMTDPRLTPHFRTGSVIATADAVNGLATIGSQIEASTQLALADTIVITKTDLGEDREALCERINSINPRAAIRHSSPNTPPSPEELFQATSASPIILHTHDHHTHSSGITTFTVLIEQPVAWPAFIDWLQLLLINRGDTILRIKGLLAVEGESRPVVINTVQHVVHTKSYLSTWPDQMPYGWLVFISRHLTEDAIKRSIRSTYASELTSL